MDGAFQQCGLASGPGRSQPATAAMDDTRWGRPHAARLSKRALHRQHAAGTAAVVGSQSQSAALATPTARTTGPKRRELRQAYLADLVSSTKRAVTITLWRPGPRQPQHPFDRRQPGRNVHRACLVASMCRCRSTFRDVAREGTRWKMPRW